MMLLHITISINKQINKTIDQQKHHIMSKAKQNAYQRINDDDGDDNQKKCQTQLLVSKPIDHKGERRRPGMVMDD